MNETNADGNTALHLAAEKGHRAIVATLLVAQECVDASSIPFFDVKHHAEA